MWEADIETTHFVRFNRLNGDNKVQQTVTNCMNTRLARVRERVDEIHTVRVQARQHQMTATRS
jgi:hypothetical protein